MNDPCPMLRHAEPGGDIAEILDAAIEIAGAEFGEVRLVDRQTGRLRLVAQRGFPSDWEAYWRSARSGLCRIALDRRARVVVEDIEASPEMAKLPSTAMLRRVGVRGLQSTPMIGRSGVVMGTFSTHTRSPLRLDAPGLRLLDLLARQAADAIERTRAAAELQAARDRQDFFRALESALRSISDAETIQYEACRRIAERLDVERAYFVEIDEAAGVARVARDVARDPALSIDPKEIFGFDTLAKRYEFKAARDAEDIPAPAAPIPPL